MTIVSLLFAFSVVSAFGFFFVSALESFFLLLVLALALAMALALALALLT